MSEDRMEAAVTLHVEATSGTEDAWVSAGRIGEQWMTWGCWGTQWTRLEPSEDAAWRTFTTTDRLMEAAWEWERMVACFLPPRDREPVLGLLRVINSARHGSEQVPAIFDAADAFAEGILAVEK